MSHFTAQVQTCWLLNAAFFQEIKDSNPNLWHETHRLRGLCELGCDALETPQATIKDLVQCLDGLRDLLALQFSLEESYGLVSSSQDEIHRQQQGGLQSKIVELTDQHQRLYLQLVDLVERSEELQYRGCDVSCLRSFVESVEQFSRDLTSHERFEDELIRLSGFCG